MVYPLIVICVSSAEVRFCRWGPLLTGPQYLHERVKKLEKQPETILLPAENNVFLIDWLTVVFHDCRVCDVMELLGLSVNTPWQEKQIFRNGYPMQTFWNGICISWGADDIRFYSSSDGKSAEDKVRHDMGICLNLSGSGCRAYEQYGRGDWMELLKYICTKKGKINITRLDLAYDDHIGLLDIHRIRSDVEDRNYVSKARKAFVIWSDDLNQDVQGLTVEVGSRQSRVLIRIYNKAAERGFDHSKHWIRVEVQLREQRAMAAVAELIQLQHIGKTASGIIRNYCTFRTPSDDTNKSRWPMADYWDKLLMDMDRISLWISPGEPYNFSKTEKHMLEQYGQAFITYYRIHGELGSFLSMCMRRFPDLKDKYQTVIAEAEMLKAERRKRLHEVRKYYGFELLPDDHPDYDLDILSIFDDGVKL